MFVSSFVAQNSMRSRATKTVCYAVLVATMVTVTLDRSEAASPEAVKAGFILNFTKFVSWPNPEQVKNNITICFEHSSIPQDIYQQLSGEKVHGTVVQTHAMRASSQDMEKCSIAVFGKGRQLSRFIRLTSKHDDILLVGESPGFLRDGGHIRLLRKNNTIRFHVNLPAIRRTGLDVRSGLLKIAEKVIRK